MHRLGQLGDDARAVFVFWRTARNGRLVPTQRDINPADIRRLLADVWIYRYEPARNDFVCRLAGENINAAWGGSIRGLTLREVVGIDRHPEAIRRWRAIIEVPQIQYGVVDEVRDGVETRTGERLVLPLSDDDGHPDRVFGYSRYDYGQTDRERVPPVWSDITTLRCDELD
ncbi:MAG: PAS domain-containing protein [Minwuia sp.]|uniref:PAS domain-containing protein n=1 Tax=Minwuia sp. TaxID=2493630 RepID=UPI003A8A97FB